MRTAGRAWVPACEIWISEKSILFIRFWKTELWVHFLPWCGPVRRPPWVFLRPVPMRFGTTVVESSRHLGVNELSTLKSKHTACLGVALISGLLSKTVSSWLSERANVAGRTQWSDSMQKEGSGELLFHPYCDDLLCTSILERNPLILPGNYFEGLFQYTWQIQRHTFIYSIQNYLELRIKK